VEEVCDVPVAECSGFLQASSVTWLNINGIHDVQLIEDLGACFGLHPMTLEDIVNTTQRPKFEEFPDYLFATLKMLAFNPVSSRIEIEHVSLILGRNFVISFLEDEGDVFDAVRQRIRTCTGRVRRHKADYLAYALMDAVVDHYFLAIEQLGDRIEEFDDRILEDPRPGDMKEIHRLKRDVLGLRKAVWPFREEISAIEKSDSPLLRSETKVFWRDLYDHTIQIIDMVETYRDILGGMHDTYLSSLSNRMNEVMKVLTIISTIFIPLTFIVGVYGMNFEHMPELRWRLGYYGVWMVMLVVALSLFGYFKRKRWL
jgi:magnesium transporter